MVNPELAFFFYFLGILTNILSPYLRKYMQSEQGITWSHKYTVTLFLSVIIALFVAGQNFNSLAIDLSQPTFFVAIGSWTVGMGTSEAIKEAKKWIGMIPEK